MSNKCLKAIYFHCFTLVFFLVSNGVSARTPICATSVSANTSITCGSSTTLTASGGITYTWSPATGLSATTGSSVTATPSTTTTYTVTAVECGTAATVTVSVNPITISGIANACTGSTQTLSADVAGGFWSSSTTSIATVGFLSGIVTGMSNTGVVTISYTAGSCVATTPFAVNAIPAITSVSAAATTCVGNALSLNSAVNSTAGPYTYSWSGPSGYTNSISLNAITNTTVVNSIGGSPTQPTYTLTVTDANGCIATGTNTVSTTVVTGPAAIAGTMTLCTAGTSTLTNSSTGGTWSSSNTTVATIGSSSGVINGSNQGTATITYSTGCGTAATTTITVKAAPAAIVGGGMVCATSTTTLSDASNGGTWSSSTPGVATITSAGVINGIAQGTTTISYNNGCGTAATQVVSVNTEPASITGTLRICSGTNTTLTNAATGGTWSSSNTGVATAGITGMVTGAAQGNATITFNNGCGADATVVVTIDAAPASIGGPGTTCIGGTATLTNSATGGTWASSTPATASINSTTGEVTGAAQGTTTITYANGCGTAASIAVTVNGNPGTVTGTANVCSGNTTTLANAATGGLWTSSNTAIATAGLFSGVITGVEQGTVTITYSNGCGTDATLVVTVNGTPTAITGANVVCNGNETILSNSAWNGTWTAGTTAVASVASTSGAVTGILQGTTTVTYTNGCGTPSTIIVTVNNSPAAITGTAALCEGTTTTLSNTATGGVWLSSADTIAAISSDGTVSGVVAGTAIITYGNGCGVQATRVVTVNPNPAAITGTTAVCIGRTTTLTDSMSGGTWSISTSGTASVTAGSGIVTGVAAGTVDITYTLGTGCFTGTLVTVEPLPLPITGMYSICATDLATLHSGPLGGIWSSSDTSVISVGLTNGVISGLAAGTSAISYSLATGCVSMAVVTVNPQPMAGTISGYTTVCIGSVDTLMPTIPGGAWKSVYPAIASADSVTGIVTGVSLGIDTIHYRITNVCGSAFTAHVVTVEYFSPMVGVSVRPTNHMCLNTQNQSVGANIGQPSGLTFTWSTNNASLVTVSPNKQFAVANFPMPGTASVKLLATIDGKGCQARDSFKATVSSEPTPEVGVSYYNAQLVCLDNTMDRYQWGYDDSNSLATHTITNATDQTYYLPNPDFGNKRYWVKVYSGDCFQKAYYNAPTGTVEPVAGTADVHLFPNPAETEVTVEVNGLNKTENLIAQITDVSGRNLGTYMLNGGKETIPVQQLASGTYYVVLTQNGMKVAATVFVKQ
jgi:uncharacterized protein YjdB